MKALVTFVVILNVVGLLVFGWLGFRATMLAPIDASARYTMLDRAQVIDEERLAEAFPDLGPNSRHLVPKWIVEPVVETGKSLALCGLILAGLNLVAVFALSRGITRKPRSAGDTARPDGNASP